MGVVDSIVGHVGEGVWKSSGAMKLRMSDDA